MTGPRLRPRIIVLLAALVLPLILVLPPHRVTAQDAEPTKVWQVPEAGFEWTRLDDQRWKFVPEDQWGRRYGGEKPPFLICMLGKWESPEGELGKDPWQVLATVFVYAPGAKIKVGGQQVDPGNVKNLCEANYRMDSESRYKDLKNVKKPGPRKVGFAKEAFAWSFTGLHVKSGQVSWKELWCFRSGREYSFLVDINCPAGDEVALRKDIDLLLEGIKLSAPKTTK